MALYPLGTARCAQHLERCGHFRVYGQLRTAVFTGMCTSLPCQKKKTELVTPPKIELGTMRTQVENDTIAPPPLHFVTHKSSLLAVKVKKGRKKSHLQRESTRSNMYRVPKSFEETILVCDEFHKNEKVTINPNVLID